MKELRKPKPLAAGWNTCDSLRQTLERRGSRRTAKKPFCALTSSGRCNSEVLVKTIRASETARFLALYMIECCGRRVNRNPWMRRRKTQNPFLRRTSPITRKLLAQP